MQCFEEIQMSAIPANVDFGGLAYESTARLRARPFVPHPLLRNPHLATVAAAYWPRDFASLPPATNRLFEVEPGTRLLAKCHWQRSEEHTSELQSQSNLVCRLLLEKKKKTPTRYL